MAETGIGLSAREASARLERDGRNVVFMPSRVTFGAILWEEVREPMILLLLAVGLLYSVFGEVEDAITIFAVILLLALAEVQNEYRAKRAVQRLEEVTSPRAAVVRDGVVTRVDTAEIVAGDALVLAAGTRVAADGRVARTTGLQVDESSITGESYPAEKAEGEPVFAGTVVVSGDGVAEVTATGKATVLGSLAEGLKTVRPPKTPLQVAMRELSGKLVWVAVAFSVAIPLLGVVRGRPLAEMILIGLSLSFATIPEELPIIITMVLGLGSYRLSKRGFLVRRLSAAETMGAVDVIVTDKTGTLTESRMRLTKVFSEAPEVEALAAAMIAVSEIDTTPIDLALREAASGRGVPADGRRIARKRALGDGAKTRAVLRSDGTLVVSGAPEQVFEHSASLPPGIRERSEEQASEGARLIAVATRQVPEEQRGAAWEVLERELDFVALLAFSDPPRPEVRGAIEAMKGAGVRTVMVTGDHPATAGAVARSVGIADGESEVVTGDEIEPMDEAALDAALDRSAVFARTTPQHKHRIVGALQRRGLRVAATGDGINDALAIKGADVGIAMGIRGTDVAKDAADAILADDDYASIANAIFEGRVFHDNLRKGVKYYLSVKAALIAVFLLPAVAGLPMPFSPVQIILLELFMDLAASAGFVAEPPEPDVATRRPEEMRGSVLDAAQVRDLAVKGSFLFVPVMVAFWYGGARGAGPAAQGSLAFSAWMIGHVALAFVSRSDRRPLASVGLFSNRVVDLWALATAAFLGIGLYVPAIGARLDLVPVPPGLLIAVVLGVAVWMSLLELRKHAHSRGPGRPAPSQASRTHDATSPSISPAERTSR